ncbi:MAG: hypothetical protein ACYC8T_01345 [Myxococcaceae bacterium]
MDKPRQRTPQAPKYPRLAAALLGAAALAGCGLEESLNFQRLTSPEGVDAGRQVQDSGPTQADNFLGGAAPPDYEDTWYPGPDGGTTR